MIKVALHQHACGSNPAENLQLVLQGIDQAAAAGAQLVLLQELHNSRYFCQRENPDLFDLAETIPGPSTDAIGALAAKHEIVVVASLFEKRAPGLAHNTAVVLDGDQGIVGRYRKMHIPEDPGYHEKFYFTPGDADQNSGFQPIQTRIGKLGVLVCWDQWYPEAARLMTLRGADMLLYPTAIGWDANDTEDEQARQLGAWQIVQRGHAVANGLPVLACNRIGTEPDPDGINPGTPFWGHSFVCGPQGEMLAEAGTDAELLVTEVDTQRTDTVRRMWPFLRDRRIDAYAGLLKRFDDE